MGMEFERLNRRGESLALRTRTRGQRNFVEASFRTIHRSQFKAMWLRPGVETLLDASFFQKNCKRLRVGSGLGSCGLG